MARPARRPVRRGPRENGDSFPTRGRRERAADESRRAARKPWGRNGSMRGWRSAAAQAVAGVPLRRGRLPGSGSTSRSERRLRLRDPDVTIPPEGSPGDRSRSPRQRPSAVDEEISSGGARYEALLPGRRNAAGSRPRPAPVWERRPHGLPLREDAALQARFGGRRHRHQKRTEADDLPCRRSTGRGDPWLVTGPKVQRAGAIARRRRSLPAGPSSLPAVSSRTAPRVALSLIRRDNRCGRRNPLGRLLCNRA